MSYIGVVENVRRVELPPDPHSALVVAGLRYVAVELERVDRQQHELRARLGNLETEFGFNDADHTDRADQLDDAIGKLADHVAILRHAVEANTRLERHVTDPDNDVRLPAVYDPPRTPQPPVA